MMAAARQRTYRARQRAGEACLVVTVDEAAVSTMLVCAGLLDPLQADDRYAIQDALAKQIELLCRLTDRYA